MTRKTNMTKIGNRPRASQTLLVLNKAAPTTTKKAAPVANKKAAPVANKNERLRFSMHAYKHFMAVPFAKIGLHDPKAPNYHNELVQNMRNYQKARPELLPMHNKEWFVSQLKRNVWALQNNKAVANPVPKNAVRCPMSTTVGASKTRRLLNARKGVKTAANPKKMTNKQLSEQLKAVTQRLKATK
jgi:hypothetical protein